ncbi:MAG: DUF4271 domain-containing protein [Muribaculaceae bacterium]|nr:DUF4271 domain-containing protein [Muribaculaceae bacterium]
MPTFIFAHTTITLTTGLAPEALASALSANVVLTIILFSMIVLMAFNIGEISRALKSYRHELWNIRRRPNVFDDDNTVSVPASLSLALIFIVFGGIVLYYIPALPIHPSLVGVLSAMALLAIYFIFRLVIYRTLGYTFADKDGKRQLVNGFLATQAYAGLSMIIPAFLLVYKPEWRLFLLITSLSVYCIANIIFIGKGFRIFYRNFQSLLYFILYLCAVEIIPVLAICRISAYMWS